MLVQVLAELQGFGAALSDFRNHFLGRHQHKALLGPEVLDAARDGWQLRALVGVLGDFLPVKHDGDQPRARHDPYFHLLADVAVRHAVSVTVK